MLSCTDTSKAEVAQAGLTLWRLQTAHLAETQPLLLLEQEPGPSPLPWLVQQAFWWQQLGLSLEFCLLCL